ncbi:hypothetical protein EV142_101426 [Flavobacterium circumlabens]|uniref:Uncharacterized protein n=1 Tax=Flavobacterium circumlabens TaxID=2133765 RepID=A0ABY2B4T6_9FLAO|nr:hypothetical protein EV142_101426 [Flavobacterium circumlabens]
MILKERFFVSDDLITKQICGIKTGGKTANRQTTF